MAAAIGNFGIGLEPDLVEVRVNISDWCEQLVFVESLGDFMEWFRRTYHMKALVDFEGEETFMIVKVPRKRLEYLLKKREGLNFKAFLEETGWSQ